MNKLKTFLWVFLGLFALVAVGAFAVQASPINTTSNNEATTPDEPVDIVEYTNYTFDLNNSRVRSLNSFDGCLPGELPNPMIIINGIENVDFKVGVVYSIGLLPINSDMQIVRVSHNGVDLTLTADNVYEFTATKNGVFSVVADYCYTNYNFDLINVDVHDLRMSDGMGGFFVVWSGVDPFCAIDEFNFRVGTEYEIMLSPDDTGIIKCITNVNHNDNVLFSGVNRVTQYYCFTAVENGTLSATAEVCYTNYSINNVNTDYELYYYDINTQTQNLVDLSAGIGNYQFLVGGHYKFVFTPYSGFCVNEVVHNLEILSQGAYSNGAYEVEFVAVNNGTFYVTSSVFTQIYSIEINNGNYELYAWDGTGSYNPIDLSQGLKNYQFTVGGAYKLVVTPYTGFNNVTVNHGGEILFDSVPVDSALEIEFKAKLNGMFQIDCYIV